MMEDQRQYKYRCEVDPQKADHAESGVKIIFENKEYVIPFFVFEFSSIVKLTKKEVEDKIRNTQGVSEIKGDFKLVEFLNPLPEPRYYTPSIEEFHIGFPYEWLNENNDWIKEDSLTELTADGFDEQTYGLRVKYLDRSDIESLGWEPDFERAWCVNEFDGKYDRHMHFHIWDKHAAMTYRIDKGFVTIRNENQYFKLVAEAATYKIKNKSELKRLMVQLGIIE